MSVRTAFINKVFSGRADPLSHIVNYDGVPAYNAEHAGELVYDYTNEDGYIATDTAGTWVKLNA